MDAELQSALANAEAAARKRAAQARQRMEDRLSKREILVGRGKHFVAVGGCDADGMWWLALPYATAADRADVDRFLFDLGVRGDTT